MSHVAGLTPAAVGGRALADASPGVVAVPTGALLILSAYAAILCLGCWAAVARAAK